MSSFTTDDAGRRSPMFWGEIAPCEHLVQIYEGESAFLDTLEGFITAGLRNGEGVVVIATSAHLGELESRLRASGLLSAQGMRDRYVALSAEGCLARFMVDGWPDDSLFESTVADLLARAGEGGRRVRAFGEMVAILWQRGQTAATVHLEQLWHRLCQTHGFCLFCAYPREIFTTNAAASIKEICQAHSKVVHA